jgi:hypothetical protein
MTPDKRRRRRRDVHPRRETMDIGMTKRDCNLPDLRFMEIAAELEALALGGVVDGNPADVEAALLREQDDIKYRLGADWFETAGCGVSLARRVRSAASESPPRPGPRQVAPGHCSELRPAVDRCPGPANNSARDGAAQSSGWLSDARRSRIWVMASQQYTRAAYLLRKAELSQVSHRRQSGPRFAPEDDA